MRDLTQHTGPVFGMWHGGAGYGFGDPATDGERFASIEAAQDALLDRYQSGSALHDFQYVNRPDECTSTPAVDETSTIHLCVALPEGGDFTDVYPDLVIRLSVDDDGEATALVRHA